MISIFTGLPGSGKSLHSARVIRRYLRRRKPVFCNFPINGDSLGCDGWEDCFHYRSNDDLDPAELVAFSKSRFADGRPVEDDILLVVDEAQLVFNSRNWNDSRRMDWLLFFSQHRHFGYRVVLVAQDAQMIDKQFRALIEYEHNHRKMANFGTIGAVFTLFGLIPLFQDAQYMFQTETRIGTNWFVPSKRLYSLYDSYRLFGKD